MRPNQKMEMIRQQTIRKSFCKRVKMLGVEMKEVQLILVLLKKGFSIVSPIK